MEAAPNAITGMTWLREVSDGFMYKDVEDGTKKCNICTESEQPGKVQEWFDPENPEQGFEAIDFLDEEFVSRLQTRWIDCKRCGGSQQMKKFKKITKEIPCPKEQKLAERLEQCEETGRIVIFAGFQGSLDRIEKLCHKNQWDVVRCDGRGWHVTTKENKVVRTDEPLRYWLDFSNQRVAFVAHPQSGGLSLNLTESRMAVFYSNDFNPESRSQAEDRVHRMGMDENRGCKIVDIFHLPSDTRVRQILRENRKLELMTMGEFSSLQVQILNAT
jgi:SNF2 family DNA or RNA helicase